MKIQITIKNTIIVTTAIILLLHIPLFGNGINVKEISVKIEEFPKINISHSRLYPGSTDSIKLENIDLKFQKIKEIPGVTIRYKFVLDNTTWYFSHKGEIYKQEIVKKKQAYYASSIEGIPRINSVLKVGKVLYIAAGFIGYESGDIKGGFYFIENNVLYRFKNSNTKYVYTLKLIENTIWYGAYDCIGIYSIETKKLKEYKFRNVFSAWNIEYIDDKVWIGTTDNFKDIDGVLITCSFTEDNKCKWESFIFTDASQGHGVLGGIRDIIYDEDNIYISRGDWASHNNLLFWDRKNKAWKWILFDGHGFGISSISLKDNSIIIGLEVATFSYIFGEDKMTKLR